MYLEHFGLNEAPFRITPHTEFFFSGANRGATLEALIYTITHDEGIVKVSGEVGSGKTMLCRVLMERLPDNVVIVYLANPSLSREDILFALADELGIAVPEHGRASAMLRGLQEKLVALYAEGKQVVALIDEAHAMPKETLEEIRLLSNLESSRHKLLQLVLFGQPEINETLTRPDMRQLRERITHNFNLEPMVRADIAEYLDFRMRAAGYRGPSVFTPAAIKMIADVSQGLTRRINILADKSLLAAFTVGGHQVNTLEVKAAIRDTEFSVTPFGKSRSQSLAKILLLAFGGILTILVLVMVGLGQPNNNNTVPPPRSTEGPPKETVPSPTSSTAAALPSQPERAMLTSAVHTPELDKLLDRSRPWLDTVPPDRWFIQLLITESRYPQKVEAFLATASSSGIDLDELRVYHSALSGVDRYGVIFGEFASRQEAQLALEKLPEAVKTGHPFARQTVRLR